MGAEVIQVTKSTVNRTWIGGVIVFAAGITVALIGTGLMLAFAGTFNQVPGNDYNFEARIDPFFWTTVWVIVAGGILAGVGALVQLAAWIGALVNSYLLPEKTWFAILLIGGIFGFFFGLVGFAVMLAYVISAPDGTPYKQVHVAAPPTLAPTT